MSEGSHFLARLIHDGCPRLTRRAHHALSIGRSIFDALVALEFVQDSHEDEYAKQLQPELGHLLADIQSGFQYVDKCIHGWRFDVSPPAINLEEDILRLENRMAQVRHTGANFSQAEILRTHAVQLHIKQIARLCRNY